MVQPAIEQAVLRRSVAHRVTVPAGRVRRVRHRPATGLSGLDYILVSRIAAAGVQPALLRIDVADLNRADYALQLGPDLVSTQPFVGNAASGVALTIANVSASDVVVVVQSAPISRATRDAILGERA